MSASFGTTGHNLTNGNNGAWTGTGHYWTYDRTVGNDIFYGLPNHNTDYDIKFDGSNWYDAGSNVPGWFGTSATDDTQINPPGSATVLYFWSYTNANQNATVFIADITNNDPQSSGPTVTSITATTIFVPSDTVTNTDFTLLENGSAYANSNISLTGPGAQPPSDARGYAYTLVYNGSAYYDVTIDSKTFFGSYYDDTWTSSPTSGRNPQTSSSRILNVIATIPSRAISQRIDGVATAHLGTLTNNSRILTYVKNIFVSGSQTHTLTVKFWIDQKTINGTDEIVGTFSSKIEQYPPAIDGRSFNNFDYVIGAQHSMSHTLSHGGKTYVYSIIDWVYEAEPEGDGHIAPVTTTSNGGGKPDRYPLIMTNLFNRNRSLYSIGMTHKDTWDLFQ